MSNRLARTNSPYLLQHADNPVDWYPWGEEAFAAARSLNKPILLSIGYSSCHWCHVMAHESFEDPGIAETLNRGFVSVKVDREERPDVDQIYQTAHFMLTGRSGGWPLNMFLTPQGVPFFGGTYFPNQGRHGMPGFSEVAAGVAEFYRQYPREIDKQNQRLLEAFEQTLPHAAESGELRSDPLEESIAELHASFDALNGGFGGAPKFPHATEIELCLRRAASHDDRDALEMARKTLLAMAQGGLYDHVGGGFFRYCVDDAWSIPHFEKMLYDNGPLLRVYSEAWLLTREPRFEQAVRETVGWLLREMRAPEGGFYSTLDADSEHQEGKFYVWTPQAAAQVLQPDEYAVAAICYGLDEPPNFEAHLWHLQGQASAAQAAERLGMPPEQAAALLDAARGKLLDAREKRIRPGRDEKILTAWNALAIRGLTRAAQVFGEPQWLACAQTAVDFIRSRLWRDGKLLASCKDGQAELNGYLDDYAFLLEALLELLQAEFRASDLRFAQALAEALLTNFEDSQAGGFFFTGNDHESLIHRPKPGHDNPMPSGNGVAASALLRLGYLLGEPRYLGAAERAIRLFYPPMAVHAPGFGALLIALDDWLDPPSMAIVRGPSEQLVAWRNRLRAEYLPHAMTLFLSADAAELPPALAKPEATDATAWVCKSMNCQPAITDFDKLHATLRRIKSVSK